MKEISRGGLCKEKGKKADNIVVPKMTMNSTMLIKSYGAVIRCQVTDIIDVS